jgi:hypothetical protein
MSYQYDSVLAGEGIKKAAGHVRGFRNLRLKEECLADRRNWNKQTSVIIDDDLTHIYHIASPFFNYLLHPIWGQFCKSATQ